MRYAIYFVIFTLSIKSYALAQYSDEFCADPIIIVEDKQYSYLEFFVEDMHIKLAESETPVTVIGHMALMENDSSKILGYFGQTSTCFKGFSEGKGAEVLPSRSTRTDFMVRARDWGDNYSAVRLFFLNNSERMKSFRSYTVVGTFKLDDDLKTYFNVEKVFE